MWNFDKSTKYIKNFHILEQNVLTFLAKYAIIKVEDERRTLNNVLLILWVLTLQILPTKINIYKSIAYSGMISHKNKTSYWIDVHPVDDLTIYSTEQLKPRRLDVFNLNHELWILPNGWLRHWKDVIIRQRKNIKENLAKEKLNYYHLSFTGFTKKPQISWLKDSAKGFLKDSNFQRSGMIEQ